MSFTKTHDENTPLLSNQSIEDPKAFKARPTPIPKLQLGVLTALRLVEPIAFTQIFPYINQFMYDLKVTDDPSRIGFYSGIVQSMFSLCELVSIYNMAKISDRIGRRPVIFFGILGVGITTLLFGLSTSFPMMVLFRALSGLCAGNVSVMQSVIGEITDSSNQAIALPLYGLAWPLGSVLGPLLGGTFSHAAQKFSWLDWQLLRSYPYFLPCFVSFLGTVVAIFIGYYTLEETLPSKRRPTLSRMSTSSSMDTLCGLEEDSKSDVALTASELLANPIIYALSTSGFALSFLASGFEVLYVLVCYTDIQNGGLGLSTEQIGYSMSIAGVIALAFQLLLLPYIFRTFDHAKAYTGCMCLFPCMFVLLPLLNPIARSGYDASTGLLDASTTAILWTGISIVLGMSRFAYIAFALSMVLVKEANPSPSSLGMSNGITQSVICLARAIGPALTSAIFAWSIDNGILGGFGWVPFMLGMSIAGVYQSAVVSNSRSKA